jgi:putative membrane protein
MSSDPVADRRVHPATILLWAIRSSPSALLGLPASLALVSRDGAWGVLLALAIVAGLVLFYQWVAWRRFRYGIGERELVIEMGVFNRTRRSIPFDRIQDVDVEQSLLRRASGLALLRIETGGAGGDEGILDSVTLGEAERIRQALRAARPSATTAMSATRADDARPATLLFQMSVRRLLAAGMFGFSLVYIAGIFAVLQSFRQWLPFGWEEAERWLGWVEGGIARPFGIAAIAAAALVATLLGFVTGIVRTFVRDFDFRLILEAEGLRRRQGLLTLSDVLIPRQRTQLARVETGPLRRWFGYATLTFQTLGGAGNGQVGVQAAAPLARVGEIDFILEHTDFRIADPELLHSVSRRRILRRLIKLNALPMLATMAVSFVWSWAFLLLPVQIVLLAMTAAESRFHRYGLFDGLLFVERGLLKRRQWITPVVRIQSLRLSRTFLQRRFGLATLAVDTAGAPGLSGVQIEDLPEEQTRELALQLLSQPLS